MTCPPLIGNATLMRIAMSGVDLAPLGEQLLARAAADPHDANALMDMSMVLQLTGNRELALAMQRQALAIQPLYRLPARRGEPGVRLLAFMTPGDLMTNTPLDCLIEDSDVALDMLYLGADLEPPAELPEHDLLFVAIGASDRNAALLSELGEATRNWPRPVLNLPEHTAWTSREAACARLRGASGIAMPATVRLGRATLARIGSGDLPLGAALDDGAFPIIARPIDTHAGQGLVKIDAAADIATYLVDAADEEFHVSSFIDYRNADGQFRKYRVALIDGCPYACHMGISDHWMIHYLNAGMAENAAKRAEEERFMVSFESDFASRHATAFHAIQERMQLDYLVIDCAETPDGKLLIFEVDTGAVVHAMDPVEIFPYKQPQMGKVFVAFRAMLGRALQNDVA